MDWARNRYVLVHLPDNDTWNGQLENDRIFDIADIPFTQVSEEEKKKYAGKIREEGSYQGYKLRQFWVSKNTKLQDFT